MKQLPPKWYMTQIAKHFWYFIENHEGGCSSFHHKLTLCTSIPISFSGVFGEVKHVIGRHCSITTFSLMHLFLFCSVGVFQVTESDAVDVVETVLKDIRVSPDTVAFSLTALLKLSSRFSHCAE